MIRTGVVDAREGIRRGRLALVSGQGTMQRATRPDPYWTPVVVRVAVEADSVALWRLAHLDSARPLRGEVLIAEQGGALVAAISLDEDRAVADPFRASTDLVALLRLRARQLRDARTTPA